MEINECAQAAFDSCSDVAKIYGTMLMAEMIQEEQGGDTTRLHSATASTLEHLRNQIKVAIALRDSKDE